MAKEMRNALLLAKAQTGLGVAATLTAGANAILCRALTPSPINAEFVERTLVRGGKGNYGALAVGVHRVFEFEVELAGSGTAGTAPKFAPLLLGCGLSETISAGVSAAYQPVSTGEPWLTLQCYLDGVLFSLTDAKGTVSIEANAKGIPVMRFRFLGAYAAATDTAVPSGASFTGFTQPLTVGDVNTPTFSFFGTTAVMQSFSLDLANQLKWRELVNGAGARSADRKPAGSTVIELDSVATKNWGEVAREGTQGAIQLVHGTAAGRIVQIDVPTAQITQQPTLSDSDGVAMINLGFAAMPNAGNDELTLTFK